MEAATSKWRYEHGYCARCSKPRLPDAIRCAVCAEYHRTNSDKWYKAHGYKVRQAKCRDKRLNGICTDCPAPVVPGKGRCQKHLDIKAAYARKQREQKALNEAKAKAIADLAAQEEERLAKAAVDNEQRQRLNALLTTLKTKDISDALTPPEIAPPPPPTPSATGSLITKVVRTDEPADCAPPGSGNVDMNLLNKAIRKTQETGIAEPYLIKALTNTAEGIFRRYSNFHDNNGMAGDIAEYTQECTVKCLRCLHRINNDLTSWKYIYTVCLRWFFYSRREAKKDKYGVKTQSLDALLDAGFGGVGNNEGKQRAWMNMDSLF